ncbi:MAG: phosphate ABC transporter permease PstA [Deltaproteobacteria bacterium]|nr:phosphate ABC transporter permease PstA [Deltaproteobacteria bacterium]
MKRRFSDYVFRSYRKRKSVNAAMVAALVAAAVIALIPLVSVFGYVLQKGLPALNVAFFTELPKPVGETGGGMANALLGTVTLVFLGSLFGVPWGIATGLYLSEYGRGRLAGVVRFSADMLASIPSIIIGLFIYALVVVTMKRFSAIAGGLALGLLMIPTVARSSEELLKLVPEHIREAGLALGLPRWKVTLWIVLRGIRGPITTGVMLSIARVSGETAPLLFTAFSNRFWQRGLDQPISSLPVQIYTYAISPYEDWHQQAWAGALMLVMLVFAMNLLTRLALSSAERARK